MPTLIGQILPELSVLMDLALKQYHQPVNDTERALVFMEQLAPLYQLAEAIWSEKEEPNVES